jgi:hypothetical protein
MRFRFRRFRKIRFRCNPNAVYPHMSRMAHDALVGTRLVKAEVKAIMEHLDVHVLRTGFFPSAAHSHVYCSARASLQGSNRAADTSDCPCQSAREHSACKFDLLPFTTCCASCNSRNRFRSVERAFTCVSLLSGWLFTLHVPS